MVDCEELLKQNPAAARSPALFHQNTMDDQLELKWPSEQAESSTTTTTAASSKTSGKRKVKLNGPGRPRGAKTKRARIPPALQTASAELYKLYIRPHTIPDNIRACQGPHPLALVPRGSAPDMLHELAPHN